MRARGRLQFQVATVDTSIVRARQEIVQNEPICPQLDKWGGALRFYALRRAARPEAKIRPKHFFWRPRRLGDLGDLGASRLILRAAI
jgi:hypothetical protein